MKYIIFDYDGTLHNSIKIYKPAFMTAYDYLVDNGYAKKREFSDQEISKFLGLSAKDMWNTFIPNLPKCEKEKCSSIIGESMIKYISEGKTQLVIAVGCTGGKHRSVTLANELYAKLMKNHSVILSHNDIEKDSKTKRL